MAPTGTWYIWLIQCIWDTREIATKMLLIIIVLVLKGTSGDFRGIVLLEVLGCFYSCLLCFYGIHLNPWNNNR